MSKQTAKSALRFAINYGNPVLTCKDQQGQPSGISVELAGLIAQTLDCQAEFVTYPAAGKVVEDAGRGYWDVAFLAIDPKRETVLRFTEPYIVIEGTVMVRSDAVLHRVAEIDKPGLVINVGKGAAYDLWLTRNMKNAQLNRLPSSQEAIDAFLAGEGDMVAGIRQPLTEYSEKDNRYRVLPDSFTEICQAVCVPRDDDRYYQKIVILINQLKREKRLEDIINKYLANN